MSSHFLDNGNIVPVTILKAGPVTVTQIKTQEKDKYQAVQVGYGSKKSVNKALRGHIKDAGNFSYLKEFKPRKNDKEPITWEVGQKIDTGAFAVGEMVDVVGVMKGRGFAGAIKRHGFHGMPASHGHDKPRAVGSIGQRFPQHVRKGLRMAGRMGGHNVTVKNLQIVDIDVKRNLIAVKGAVPGHINGIVEIVSTGKVKELFPKPVEKKEKKK